MAEKKPICLYNGVLQELASGDTLPGGITPVVLEDTTNDLIYGGDGTIPNLTTGQITQSVLLGTNIMNYMPSIGGSIGNTMLGHQVAMNVTGPLTGVTAIGWNSVAGHVTARTPIGIYSSAFGYESGMSSKGTYGAFFGYRAGRGVNSGWTGDHNTAFGSSAMGSCSGTLVSYNAAFGNSALQGVYTSSQYNAAFGYQAGFNLGGSSTRNLFLGYGSGNKIYAGSDNIMIGPQAGPATGSHSKEMFIDITERDDPLIWADFDTPRLFKIDGNFEVTGTCTGSFGSPTTVTLDNGAAATPSLNFTLDTDTGLFNTGAGLGIAYSGAQKISIGPNVTMSSGVQLLADKASVTAPGFAFVGATNTGWYAETSPPPTKLMASVGGTKYLEISAGAITAVSPFAAPGGSVTAPGYSFSGDANTGFWSSSADQIRMTLGGNDKLIAAATYFALYNPTWGVDGTITAPTYAFNTDTNTGIFKAAADALGITAGGAERARFSSTGISVTGSIAITNSYAAISLKSTDTGATTGADFIAAYDENDYLRGYIWNGQDNASNSARDILGFYLKDGSNVQTGHFYLKDGNLTVSATAPVNDGHLTRKDYVDAIPQPSAIINGNFDVWQRGTSWPAAGTPTRVADRYSFWHIGTMVHTIAQSTDVPTYAQSGVKSNYSLHADCTTVDSSIAAGEYALLRYVVEGYDYAQLAGGNATLSFWVKGTKTGIHCVAVRNAGQNRSYVAEYTINTTNTWEKKTVTIPLTETGGTWNYTNSIGLEMTWTLACGSTFQTTKDTWQTGNYFATSNQVNACDNVANDFRIAQVKLEKGSIATPWQFTTYADEEAKCQRYFQKSYNAGHAPGTVTKDGASTWRLHATTIHLAWQAQRTLMERMRATPTVTWYSTATGTANRVRNDSIGAEYTVVGTTEQNATTTGSPTFTATGATVNNNIKTQWTADAEL